VYNSKNSKTDSFYNDGSQILNLFFWDRNGLLTRQNFFWRYFAWIQKYNAWLDTVILLFVNFRNTIINDSQAILFYSHIYIRQLNFSINIFIYSILFTYLYTAPLASYNSLFPLILPRMTESVFHWSSPNLHL